MTPPPERGGGGQEVPSYMQVANHVRLLITSHLVEAGEQLPSESDLAAKFGITRTTVREGMRILIGEGLVMSVKTKGYFVRDLREIIWPMTVRDSINASLNSAVDPWLTVIQAEGCTGRQSIKVEVVDAATTRIRGDRLSELLTIGPSGLAAVRRRVRYVTREGEQEQAQEIADSYFSFDTVKNTEIMQAEDIQPNLFALLVPLGHERTGFKDVIGSRMPTQAEIRKLDLPPGTPVLEIVRCSRFTPDDVCELVRHSVYNPNNRLSYEVGA